MSSNFSAYAIEIDGPFDYNGDDDGAIFYGEGAYKRAVARWKTLSEAVKTDGWSTNTSLASRDNLCCTAIYPAGQDGFAANPVGYIAIVHTDLDPDS